LKLLVETAATFSAHQIIFSMRMWSWSKLMRMRRGDVFI